MKKNISLLLYSFFYSFLVFFYPFVCKAIPPRSTPDYPERTHKYLTNTFEKRTIQPTLKTMDNILLKESIDRCIDSKSYDAAIRYTEQLLKVSVDPLEMRDNLLVLADLYFETKQYTKAEPFYKEFATRYPGDSKSESALCHAVICSYKELRATDQDQERTHQTIELAEKFLKTSVYTNPLYKKQVADIYHTCRRQLLENELLICNFYAAQEKTKAVELRLAYINSEFITPAISTIDELTLFKNTISQKYPVFYKSLFESPRFDKDTVHA